MKVPIYKTQGTRTSESGGIRFNVSANPSGFSIAADAEANLYGQLETTFTKLLEQETKVQREGELTKAQNSYNAINQKDEADTLLQSPNKMSNFYRLRELSNYQTAVTGIKDKVVKKRFDSWRSSQLTDTKGRIFKQQRVKIIDGAKTEQLALADQFITKMTNAKVGSLDYLKAQDGLFRPLQEVTNQDGTKTMVGGVIPMMVNMGLMSNEEAYKFTKKARSKVAENKVRMLFNDYNQNDDYAGLRALTMKIQDPNDGDFKYLTNEARTELAKKSIMLSEQIQKQVISNDAKKTANEIKVLKNNQLKNFTEMMTTIQKATLNEETDADNSGTPMPTANELLDMLSAKKIDVAQYNTLSSAIMGDNAPRNNPTVIVNFTNELQNADTPQAVDNILKKYSHKIGQKGGLKLETWNGFMAQEQAYKQKTPFAIKQKRFLSVLKGSIGEDKETNIFTKEAENPERDERMARAINQYIELTMDEKNPLDPEIAFNVVLNNYKNAIKTGFNTTMISEQILNKMNLPTDFVPNDIMKWDAQKFNMARRLIKNAPNRTVGNKHSGNFKDGNVASGQDGFTAIGKAIELRKLNIIEAHVKEQVRLSEIAKKKAKDNKMTEENPDTENDGNIFTDSFDWVRNKFMGEEDLSKREKTRQ